MFNKFYLCQHAYIYWYNQKNCRKIVNKNETSLKVKYIIFDYSASVLLIKSRLNFNQTRAKQKMIFFLKNDFIYSVIEATFSMLKKCSLFFFVAPNH